MSNAPPTSAASSSSTPAQVAGPPPLVMQLIIDPSSPSSSWPKGPWMAQSAHAAIAAIQTSLSSSNTQEYISASNLHTMHKVVLQTSTTGKSKMNLHELSTKLTEARQVYEAEANGSKDGGEFPQHYVWVEQPENVATCLAVAPNRKPAALKKILRSCTLLKD